MGRKRRPLITTLIDIHAEREARLAKAATASATLNAGEKKTQKEKRELNQQRASNQSKREQQKIIDEHDDDNLPLVIDFKGKPIPVIDPTGIWAMRTPPYMRSPNNMILATIARKPPVILAVLDFETWGLRPSVLHHAVAMRFNDDQAMLTEAHFSDVKFMYSLDAVFQYALDMLIEIIELHEKDPSSGKEAKIYVHNGSRFDLVGLALHLGIDRNMKLEKEFRVGNAVKPRKMTAQISTFSGKSKLTLSSGVGGGFRVHFIDSVDLLPSKLSDLSATVAKGQTPLQFTDPLAWLAQKESKTTGKPFNLSLVDVRSYLMLAHKKELSFFRDRLSAEAYEGLELWRGSLDDPDYSCADLVVLANALKRFAQKFRDFAKPLANTFGARIVSCLDPYSYNTISTAGFALSASYWYASRLEKHPETGELDFIKGIKYQHPKNVYALINENGVGKILEDWQVSEHTKKGVRIQRHGIVISGEAVIIHQPVYTTAVDNRFSRMAQNGSQTTIFIPMVERMKELDINSSFPAAMANGCTKKAVFEGYEYEYNGVKNRVEGSDTPVKVNALIGFEDPSMRQATATMPMFKFGIATIEQGKNEHGKEVKMVVVRGRQKILHMLQMRNGEFSVVLPPSLSPELHRIPGIPMRTPGRALDSRLINARIDRPVLMLIRGEYLASYAAHATEDDNAMVVYLADIEQTDLGENIRSRSRHGPIMGIGVNAKGQIFGEPHMPHKGFVDMVFGTRLNEKKAAKEAERVGDYALADKLKADANISKTILNGGGYGTYGQNKRPEEDFVLESVDECLGIIGRIMGLDPAWKGMREAVKTLTGEDIEDEYLGWKCLFSSIGRFIDESDFENNNTKNTWIKAMTELFAEWATNQITLFTKYTRKIVQDDGSHIKQVRGILTTADETQSHAIRPYASAVVAKSAVNLHEGQLAIERSPFGLAYSDTDSVHIETGIIKQISDPVAIQIIADEWEKRTGKVPENPQQALLSMMVNDNLDSNSLIKKLVEIYGIKVGDQLGEWGLERHCYSKGLMPKEFDDQPYISHKTFYFGPKVYCDLDKDNNVARAKVRAIPKINPLQPAVFQGHVVNTPNLADRRGLVQENVHAVDLTKSRKIYQGNKFVEVNGLFASPRRIYPDMKSSEPFAFSYNADLDKRILNGEEIRPNILSIYATKKITVNLNQAEILGLNEAYLEYASTAIIHGKTFTQAQKEIGDKTWKVKEQIKNHDLKYQEMGEEETGLIMYADEDSYAQFEDQIETDIKADLK